MLKKLTSRFYTKALNADMHEDFSCPVENIRLDNVMYMSIINDVSCLVDNKIVVLAEHQSTINENMPVQILYLLVQYLLTSFCSRKNIAAA